ncbi:MAG: hypothetical protein ABFD92_16840 [Planctomycetaceae bacterium]|nr:hypothetical protein [Planctomycetaceae bacterium]
MATTLGPNYRRDVDRLTAKLKAMLDSGAVLEEFVKGSGETVTKVVIGSAKAGIGPDNQPYAPYSQSYQKKLQLSSSGGDFKRYSRRAKSGPAYPAALAKLWLTLSGDMLSPKRFTWQVQDKHLFLVWKGPLWGPVHQGSAHGGASDTRGRIPPRPWLHFANSRNANAVITGLRKAFKAVAAKAVAG